MELTKTERHALGNLVRQMNGPPLPLARRGPLSREEVNTLSATRLRRLAARYEIPHRIWATERVAFHNLPRERQISLLVEEMRAQTVNRYTTASKITTDLQAAFIDFLTYRRG